MRGIVLYYRGTTWRVTDNQEEVTCKTCLRCLNRYKERIQAIIAEYADVPTGKLLALLLDNYQYVNRDCYYYGGEEAQKLHTALSFRLLAAGIISNLQELDINYWELIDANH